MTSYIVLKDGAAYGKFRGKRGGRLDVCDGPGETLEMMEACLRGEFMNYDEFDRLTKQRNALISRSHLLGLVSRCENRTRQGGDNCDQPEATMGARDARAS